MSENPNRMSVTYLKKPCYDIVFEKNFDCLTKEIEALDFTDRKMCIITDSNVAPLYADEVKSKLVSIAKQVDIFVFDAGEKQKTLDTVRCAYTFLIENKYQRKDLIIALGGGVVGDIAGYTAATYLRGIDFVQIPTTTLSQADSSIGGKTGVDFDGYKNMVGAFKMPRLVYMNISTLKSLDERQYFNGFAEIMKHGLIKDLEFYQWLIENMYEICERDEDTLIEMIMKSSNVKRLVVEKDPTEQGDRALLNFGHTIGHAIEKSKDFAMLHGECVALGCVAAAYISWKKEYIKMEDYYEVRDMFVPFNLPISLDEININQVIEYTKSDKKSDKDGIRFVLLKKVGKAIIDTSVTEQEIRDALNEIYFSEEDARE